MENKGNIIIIFMVLSLTATGVVGYSYIEGWSFLESLYMTVITLTTTGFQELKPLSEAGRQFTMVLLTVGMGVVAYSVTSLMSFVVNIDFAKRKRDKMNKSIKDLKDHIIVCGFGRMGRVICQQLYQNENPFVVIEKAEEHLQELKKSNYLYISGDAANDDTLLESGVENARF